MFCFVFFPPRLSGHTRCAAHAAGRPALRLLRAIGKKAAPAKQRQRPPENAFSPLCGVLASSTDSARSAQRQVCFAGSTHSPQCLRNARAGKRSAQANATPLTGKFAKDRPGTHSARGALCLLHPQRAQQRAAPMRGPHLLLRQHTQPPEVVAYTQESAKAVRLLVYAGGATDRPAAQLLLFATDRPRRHRPPHNARAKTLPPQTAPERAARVLLIGAC